MLNDREKVRFWSYVCVGDPDDCWEWILSKSRGGYGRFGLKGKRIPAHRLAYELVKGSIPTGMYVCHKCDNPACVNPRHLWVGTQIDNVRDMWKKDREGKVGCPKGTKNLTGDQCVQIKEEVAKGDAKHLIAARFGVNRQTIYNVLSELGSH